MACPGGGGVLLPFMAAEKEANQPVEGGEEEETGSAARTARRGLIVVDVFLSYEAVGGGGVGGWVARCVKAKGFASGVFTI